jgi:hypothetical protein
VNSISCSKTAYISNLQTTSESVITPGREGRAEHPAASLTPQD